MTSSPRRTASNAFIALHNLRPFGRLQAAAVGDGPKLAVEEEAAPPRRVRRRARTTADGARSRSPLRKLEKASGTDRGHLASCRAGAAPRVAPVYKGRGRAHPLFPQQCSPQLLSPSHKLTNNLTL